MLLIVQVIADCEDADIATVLASRHDAHQLSDVRASQQSETLDIVLGAIDTFDSRGLAVIYFLDYSACEVKWVKYWLDMGSLHDLTFVNESNNIAGLMQYSTYKYFFVINNSNPDLFNESTEQPNLRIWQFTLPTVSSHFDMLVQADDPNSIYFMESYRFGYIDFS